MHHSTQRPDSKKEGDQSKPSLCGAQDYPILSASSWLRWVSLSRKLKDLICSLCQPRGNSQECQPAIAQLTSAPDRGMTTYLAILDQADDVFKAVVAEEYCLQDRSVSTIQHLWNGICGERAFTWYQANKGVTSPAIQGTWPGLGARSRECHWGVSGSRSHRAIPVLPDLVSRQMAHPTRTAHEGVEEGDIYLLTSSVFCKGHLLPEAGI